LAPSLVLIHQPCTDAPALRRKAGAMAEPTPRRTGQGAGSSRLKRIVA
jgi:hypothetical protein